MEEESIKFYCDDSLQEEDESKWQYLLEYAFGKADEVEFNKLFSDHKLIPELVDLADYLIEEGERSNKIYPGYCLKFKLSNKVKHFIKSKKYTEWFNFNLEDISFLENGYEFFATITHENYIILELTEKQREEFKEKGFDFWWEW